MAAVAYAGCVEASANRVISNTRQILDTAAPDQNHAVLLQVVTFATDVARHLKTVGQAHTRDFPKSRVRFLRCGRVNTSTNTTLLRASFQCRYIALVSFVLARLAYELI